MNSQEEIQIPKQIGPYIFRADIGSGGFSQVKLAYNTETRLYSACKVIRKRVISTQHLIDSLENELKINQKLHHTGIVDLIDVLKDDNFYYVILEYCPNGDLFDHIVERKRLSETEAKNYIKQILEAVQYLHEQGVVHRDLKPENILFGHGDRLKIADFGFSMVIPRNVLTSSICGSPMYCAPEVISGQPYDPYKSDIWSCGVILYAMLTGMVPWTAKNHTQLFQQIRSGDYTTPTFLSDQCRNLINKMMCVDASKRISIEEILKHPWMKNAECPTKLGSCLYGKVSISQINTIIDKPDQETNEEVSSSILPPIDSTRSPESPAKEVTKTQFKNEEPISKKRMACNSRIKIKTAPISAGSRTRTSLKQPYHIVNQNANRCLYTTCRRTVLK